MLFSLLGDELKNCKMTKKEGTVYTANTELWIRGYHKNSMNLCLIDCDNCGWAKIPRDQSGYSQ